MMSSRRGVPASTLPALPAITLLCLALTLHGASACSVFALSAEGRTVVGRNLDWDTSVPGLLLVNVKGVEKTALPWSGCRPDTSNLWPTVSWTSKHGSVTLTCYGRDFIESGMNEAGLVVAEASLPAEFPAPDERPGMSCAQWLQYQLDNHASTSEVLAHLGDLRLDGEGWHFLVADSGGDCAVIEFSGGGPVVHRCEHDCAITNAPYALAVSHMPMDVAFGGELDLAANRDSFGRFVTIARLNRDYDPAMGRGLPEHALVVLDAVGGEDTMRSVVYDPTRLRVLWRTPGEPALRELALASVDLSRGARTLMLEVDAGVAGNVAGSLEEFSVDANLAVARAALTSIHRPEATRADAPSSDSFADAARRIAVHCVP